MNEFPRGKFVQVRRRINGDVLTREGLCRVLMWAALFRNWTLRDWLTAAEIGWKPWRVGKFKKSASSEDITILKSALQRMSSTGTAALPETVDLLVEWPKGATSSTQSLHKELCEFLAGEISKAVLGQTLTTEAGARGARSLGDTQAANSLRPRIEADAEVISSALTRDLVSAFYQINFGNAEGARWVFQTEDRQNTEAFAKAIKDLRDAGLEIPAGWVRDQIGMPPPKPGEEMLAGAEAEESEDDDSESNGNGGKEADSEDSSEDSGESSDDSKE
jgi:phage gp29-like protein